MDVWISRNRRLALIGLVLSAIMTAGLVWAQDKVELVWTKVDLAPIRAGTGAIYPVLATVPKGTQLTVIGHESNGWLKVQVQIGKDKDAKLVEGYVYQGAMTDSQPNGFITAVTNIDVANAGSANSAAAGKGLTADSEALAASANMDSKPLNDLIARSHSIKPTELEQFDEQGQVGPYISANPFPTTAPSPTSKPWQF